MGINLIMTAVMATAVTGGCSWAHPGANPYRGEPPTALADFTMPEETRRKLRTLMAARRYTDIATITRDGIVGQARYGALREMHSGHGQLCHGDVDRSAWSPTHEERGLVYCIGETCVIVPTVCNNVSLVTRQPDEAPLLGAEDEAIDINPAAGAPVASPDVAVAQAPESGPLEFIAPQDISVAPDVPEGGGLGSFGGGSGLGGPSGLPGGETVGGPTLPGGTCCGTGLTLPGGPIEGGSPQVITVAMPVPEAPGWSLLAAGLAVLAAVRRRRR